MSRFLRNLFILPTMTWVLVGFVETWDFHVSCVFVTFSQIVIKWKRGYVVGYGHLVFSLLTGVSGSSENRFSLSSLRAERIPSSVSEMYCKVGRKRQFKSCTTAFEESIELAVVNNATITFCLQMSIENTIKSKMHVPTFANSGLMPFSVVLSSPSCKQLSVKDRSNTSGERKKKKKKDLWPLASS